MQNVPQYNDKETLEPSCVCLDVVVTLFFVSIQDLVTYILQCPELSLELLHFPGAHMV